MHKSLLKLLGIIVSLMLSTTVSAIGLGGIDVASALGQTLKADIKLLEISKSEKDSLTVRLASPDAYTNSNLAYPYGNKFKFDIQTSPDGQSYISVGSAQPVNDPFVSLLVELSWSSGKLTREYTFLLDPPGYQPVQPAPVAVRPLAPEVPVAATSAASAVPAVAQEATITPVKQAAPVAEAMPAEQAVQGSAQQNEQAAPVQTTVMPASKAAITEVATLPKNKEWLAVKRGDTLYKLAARYKLADMNLDRMLVALYRANADKFDGKNMNRIRTGKILRLPTQDEYANVTQAEAVKEIHAQAANWNAYRQKLASAASASNQTQDMQQIASGKISSSVADMAPVAKESAKEVLKLSRGEAPGDEIGSATGGKSATTEQDTKNAAQENAIAKSKSLGESQARAAMLEKNIQDMKRLAQLKVEAAALAQATVAPKGAVSEVVATKTAKPVPVAVAKPRIPPPKQVKAEPSLIDQIMDEPIYLAGGAAALLALGGLGFMIFRRKRSASDFAEEMHKSFGDQTGRMAAPVVPSPDTGDFTAMAATAAVAAPHQAEEASESDVVDPVSEADLFLNFGRDAQAEEILKDALQNSPGSSPIMLKLLGIYANRKDTNSFSQFARKLQDSGDEGAWKQAIAMGRKLEPDNPMYGGGFRSMEDTGSATVQVAALKPAASAAHAAKDKASALDFDFDVGASSTQSTASPEQDYLNNTEITSVMSDDGKLAARAATMDFDITDDKTITIVGGGLDFDITSTNPAIPAAGESLGSSVPKLDDLVFQPSGKLSSFKPGSSMHGTGKAETAGDPGMEFTLDFPVEKPAEKPTAAVQPSSGNFAGINLNFDDVPSSGSTVENKDESWQDVATKLDLAKAYHEMGDASGAREILDEVMREGDAQQRESAQAILEQLG